MSSRKVTPRTVKVNGKNYKIATVTAPQSWGRTDQDVGSDLIETFRGERLAVLKPA